MIKKMITGKKILVLALAMLLAIMSLASCGKSEESNHGDSSESTEANGSADSGSETVTLLVNTEGYGGTIAYALEGEKIEFEEEYPVQSIAVNVEKGTSVTLAAQGDEEVRFFRWTKDGEMVSKDAEMVVTVEEDTEYRAVFGDINSIDPSEVDLDTVKTLGDVLDLPSPGYSFIGEMYIFAFDYDGTIYRVVSDVPEDVSTAIWDLEFEDPEYESKMKELLSPLEIKEIKNLNEGIPTQEEMDKLIGKTGEELLNDGWNFFGYDLDDLTFYMNHSFYSFIMEMEGDIGDANVDNFEESGAFNNLIVKSVTYERIGDATNMDDLLGE